jgi:arylsulfatase A-like enzyme
MRNPALTAILTLAITLLALLAGCGAETEPVAENRPNILFLFADDQRADTIAAWGNSRIQTPNIDRLVEQGFSFRSNYNMGANGGAVCVPSRAMVNSGRTYFRVPMDLEGAKLMPELLRENGYTTFATGKWHNQRPSWQRSFELGKAIMFGGMSDHTKVPLVDLMPDGTFGDDREEGFSSELFADAAIDFLKNHEEDKPFYAYVAFTAPHDPRQPPEEFREIYYERRPLMPPNFMRQHPFNLGPDMTGRDENLAAWPREKEVISDQLAEYYGLITHLDLQIGRVLQALDESGHGSDTIIIYAADHGLAVGSHGLLGKQNLYEHSQKCPLIFVGPGIPKRQSTTALTYLLDIFPTVASLTGVTPPAGLDGHDLAPIWREETESVRDALFLGFKDWMRAIRDDRYKLIRYPQIDHTQLFDLETDPDELKDLASDPTQADRVAQLTELLERWQEKVGDTQPLVVADTQPMKVRLTGRKREPDKWQPDWIVRKYF